MLPHKYHVREGAMKVGGNVPDTLKHQEHSHLAVIFNELDKAVTR